MREILFRGKRIDSGEWVEGFYVSTRDIVSEEILHIIVRNPADSCGCEIWDFEVVDPESISQFTGLTDKNGKKIFEGDILDYFGISYVVSWSKELLTYIVTSVNEKKDYLFCLNKANMDSVYVIGNVHDDPDLMEVRE